MCTLSNRYPFPNIKADLSQEQLEETDEQLEDLSISRFKTCVAGI